MKLVCISDTHARFSEIEIPKCDILIIAGDISVKGNIWELESFSRWLKTQSNNFNKVILISGNHDWFFQIDKPLSLEILKRDLGDKIEYLQDSEIIIDGVKIYGTPWQPEFHNWAFNMKRGERIRKIWEAIPDDVNILVTHGPPHGIGDLVRNRIHAGCLELLKRTQELKELKLHVFGHIHPGNGTFISDDILGVVFCNASICDDNYQATNSGYSFIIENGIIINSEKINLRKTVVNEKNQ
jgi:Icc-related predicted phosphoesterase